MRRLLAASTSVSMALAANAAHASTPIAFATPQNITGDTDVFNLGAPVYAYDWANSSTTVNGVSFTGTTSIVGSGDRNMAMTITTTGTDTGAIADSLNSYTSTAYPFAGLSTAYKSLLVGGCWDSFGTGKETIYATMNNLSGSHVYALQVWENDPRPKAGRYGTFSSTGGNSVEVNYSVNSVAGSGGQYSIGGFTADSSGSETFSDLGNVDTQLNLMQLRDVTGVWSGAASGNWDGSSANFTSGNSFTTVASLVNSVYFGDTDGFGNPITNSNITIQNGGVSIGSVVFQNNALNYSVTSSDSNGISGTSSVLKTGSGMVTVSGMNTYSGGTTLNAGVMQFNAGALPSTGMVTISSAASLNAIGAFATVGGWLGSGNIAASSSGDIALTGNSEENINFSGFPTLMLGATVNSNYTGSLTPAGTAYHLGGGGAILTISGTNALSGANALVVGANGSSGTVMLASSNTYTGGTTLVAGTLIVGSNGTLGSNVSGNNVSIGAGLNLLLSAGSNLGGSQKLTINSTSSAVGGIGIGFTPAVFPTFNDTGSLGGVFGINYTGTAGVASMASLDTALDTGGATGHWFLGSQTTGTFNGSSLAAASDKNYRLGGGGGILTISGTDVLTGSNSLIIGQTAANGAGTVVLAGAQTFTGTTTLNAGVLNISSDASLGAVPASATNNIIFSGSATLQAGAPSVTLNVNRNISIGNSSTVTFDTNGSSLTIPGVINSSAGSINVIGGGTLTLTGKETYPGLTSVMSGSLTYGGAATSGVSSNTLYALSLGTSTGSGVVNVNTTGTLDFGNTTIGGGSGSGAVNQYSGIVNLYPSSNYVNIGSGGYGAYLLAGGTLNTPSNTGIKVGFGGMGSFLQTGGTLNDSRYFIVGTQTNTGNGVATFTGGTAGVTNGSYNVDIGDAAGGIGVMNIGTQAGGTATFTTGSSPTGVQDTDLLETTGSGTINLNAGILAIQGGPITKGGSATSTAVVNLNGGTLQAGLLGSLLIDNTINSINVYNGGLIVDTQGNGTAISGNLSGTNGNGIYANSGGGVITVPSNNGSGYIGAPLVTVSGGSGTGAMAIANVSNGAITGVVLTNPGQGYQAGDTVSFTFAGGGASSPAQTFQYTLQSSDITPNTTGGLTLINGGSLTLSGTNTYTGPTNVSAGSLILASAGALPAGANLSIAAGASVIANNLGTPRALVVGTLSIAGELQLNNNSLVVHDSTLSAVAALVQASYNNGTWSGTTGIVSSSAATDTTFLTALGVISNDDGTGHALYGAGAPLGLFDGSSPALDDVLVKYTYYGDANLDGKVDGSDYARIDNGSLNHLTGWGNGDFNYDGVVDGSDYTLIDNAYNTQGAQLSAEIASSTAQIADPTATSAVPEPASLGLLVIGAVGLLGRRNRRRI
jgi:autotransporter-associated beta strand protein